MVRCGSVPSHARDLYPDEVRVIVHVRADRAATADATSTLRARGATPGERPRP